jgi:hypothetical protein
LLSDDPALNGLLERWKTQLLVGGGLSTARDIVSYVLEREYSFEDHSPPMASAPEPQYHLPSPPRHHERDITRSPGPLPTQAPPRQTRTALARSLSNIGIAAAAGIGAAGAAVLGVGAAGIAIVRSAISSISNSGSNRAATPESGAAEAGSQASERFTDVSLFRGHPSNLGEKLSAKDTLKFSHVYTIEVAIRHTPLGLELRAGERSNVSQSLSATTISEIYAALTTPDFEPGQDDDFDIPYPVQRLVVPAAGDSEDNALFEIRPRRGMGNPRLARLTLRLYHRLDLIDQYQLHLSIGPTESQTGAVFENYLGPAEKTPLPAFVTKLTPRSANIVVSRSPDSSKIRLDFILPERNAHFVGNVIITCNDLEDLFSKIRDRLLSVALEYPVDGAAFGSERFLDHVRKLAQLGEQAKQLLFDFDKVGSGESLRNIERILRETLSSGSIIQIAIDESASDFRFPWSILYLGSDPRLASDVRDFWGYRFVIEEKPASVTLVSLHENERRDLSFAAWNRLRTVKVHQAALELGREAAPPVSLKTIESRDQLLSALRMDATDVFYVFAHGHSCQPFRPAISALIDKFHSASPTPAVLELLKLFTEEELPGLAESDDSWIKLTKSLVTSADLRRDSYTLERHPIVILNMCQSAVLWPGVSCSFVKLFLERKASAVIGTECTIPENVADLFGRLVMERLFRGETLGAAFRSAREQLANQNNVLGLAYSLYGSASARL